MEGGSIVDGRTQKKSDPPDDSIWLYGSKAGLMVHALNDGQSWESPLHDRKSENLSVLFKSVIQDHSATVWGILGILQYQNHR